MNTAEEQRCLSHDPWGWDETQYHLLRDGFVRVRKPHPCQCCGHEIRPGMRVRSRAEIDLDDQRRATFYWCIQCCEAMARVNDDNGESLEHRYAMGQKKAGSLPWDA